MPFRWFCHEVAHLILPGQTQRGQVSSCMFAGDANTNVETIDEIEIRTRRAIPDCEIVEVYAFVDQSEWNL